MWDLANSADKHRAGKQKRREQNKDGDLFIFFHGQLLQRGRKTNQLLDREKAWGTPANLEYCQEVHNSNS
jgi:hypothetical protein